MIPANLRHSKMGGENYGSGHTSCTRMCTVRTGCFDAIWRCSAWEDSLLDIIWRICRQPWYWLTRSSTCKKPWIPNPWDRWLQLYPQLWSAWLTWVLRAKQRTLGRWCSPRDCIKRIASLSFHDEYLNLESVTLAAPYFSIADGILQCVGFDSSLQKWRHLPPLTYLPAYCKPDLDLIKQYLVCSKGGILCMNVSKSIEDRLIVLNVLTKECKELPPLIHRRNPVLMHLVVDASTQSYQVIVAGSSRPGDEHLSRMTEVLDSRTWSWKRTGDLPGPDYALNEYQSGVYKDGNVFCVAFLDQERGRGILGYNLNEEKWLKNLAFPVPFSTNSTILQLLESSGEVYLFSEQESKHTVEHCVDRVEWENGTCSLKSVVREKKMGGPSLKAYPEYTCMAYSEHQVCVLNTIDHSGVVYDVRNRGEVEVLPAPPAKDLGGDGFFTLNPMSFTIEPSFGNI